jgi:hypothetical protein
MNENSACVILGTFILIVIMFLGIMLGKTFARELTLTAVVAPIYSVKQVDDTLYVDTNMKLVVNGKQLSIKQ